MKTFTPPTQERSKRTYDRLLRAATGILRDKSFDETTLSEIAARANVTVGAFYARFGSKEALLEHLEERVYRRTEADLGAAGDEIELGRLADVVRAYVRTIAIIYETERGVIRALLTRSRSDPEMDARRRAFNGRVLDLVVDNLMQRSDEFAHPRPREALRLGWLLITGALREAILFDDYYPATPEGEELMDEMTWALVAYLTSEDPFDPEAT